jgi:hypothetical protein
MGERLGITINHPITGACMKSPNLRGRYFRILTFFAGVIVRFIYWELILRYLGLRPLVRKTRAERFRREAVRVWRATSLCGLRGGVLLTKQSPRRGGDCSPALRRTQRGASVASLAMTGIIVYFSVIVMLSMASPG